MGANVLRKLAGVGIAAMTFGVAGAVAESEPMTNKTAMQYFTDEGITVGINMGNSLDAVKNWGTKYEADETAWGNKEATQEYFNKLAEYGFRLVRIPVSWVGKVRAFPVDCLGCVDGYIYELDEVWLERVAAVVGYAKNAGLKAIINIHHDSRHDLQGWLLIDEVTPDNMATHPITQKFEKMWELIAQRFKNHGDYLMFQAFNEVHDGDWGNGTADEWQIINYWNKRFTDVVRATGENNTKRYLLYYGYNTTFMIADQSSLFALPTDIAENGTTRQIVGFHYYHPNEFALNATSIYWNIPENMNHFYAPHTHWVNYKTKFIDNGIPVIIGEIGPAGYANYSGNDGYDPDSVEAAHQNRLAYIAHVYGAANVNGLVPIYWENGIYQIEYAAEGDFSLFPRNTGIPNSAKSAEVINAMIEATGGTAPIPNPNDYNSIRHSVGGRGKASAGRMQVTLRGSTLNIRVSADVRAPSSSHSVRLLDLRGKTAARFRIDESGMGSFSLAKIPAGRYIVEVKSAGKRELVPIVMSVR